MKELSIEEKARRYDEAKYIMKEYLESGNAGVIAENTIKKAFPELSESEDEKIRKDLIIYLRSILSNKKYGDKFIESWIAWLEKQQKPNYCHHEVDLSGCSEEYRKAYYDGWNNCNQQHAQLAAEQKTAWSEEDEKYVKDLVGYFTGGLSLKHTEEDIVNWFKSFKNRIQPKQEWKQENTDDLTDFENTMMHIGGSFFGENAGLDPNDTNVIKEQANILLELVPKQKWSEEDEQYLLVCKNALAKYQTTDKWDACIISHWLENKLKSLRPQSQWRPSEEQMMAIETAVNVLGKGTLSGKQLIELQEDLKKLKE